MIKVEKKQKKNYKVIRVTSNDLQLVLNHDDLRELELVGIYPDYDAERQATVFVLVYRSEAKEAG